MEVVRCLLLSGVTIVQFHVLASVYVVGQLSTQSKY